MIQRTLLKCCLLILLGSRSSSGQTAYPMLMSIEPVANQIGATSEHTIKSRYSMEGAYAVLVSGSGVRGEVVPAAKDATVDPNSKPTSGESLVVRLQVDANAIPGVRDVRVATPRGVSTVGQIVLVADPVVYEQKENDRPELAQKVDTPVTVCGRIEKAEDVDFFQFHVDAGKTLCFHVMCMRLQDRVHDLQQHADPILTIRDSSGKVIAFSDNELHADPLICHTFDRAGDYTMEIRDVRFQGNAFWEYSVAINDRPLVAATYPVGVSHSSGSSSATTSPAATSFELIGYGLSDQTRVEVTLDKGLTRGIQTLPVTMKESTVCPVNLVFSNEPILTEAEADNETVATTQTTNSQTTNSQMITLPCGVNGRIEKAGDLDCFAFDATKGQRYSFEVFARRVGSELDSHLRILNAKGEQLQLNDDIRIGKRSFSDSSIENWTVPADGRYVLELRDLHLRGGRNFVYFLHATCSEPCFNLFTDTDKTPIAAGTNGVLYVRAERKNGFDGDIQLKVDGLPTGVTAHCGRILAGKGLDGCIVFEAAKDLPPTVTNITISGTATVDSGKGVSSTASATAVVYQEIYQPGGGRGHWPVDSHVLAVTAPGDIHKVAISNAELTLKPGESKSIEVEIERAPGFDKNVTLEVSYTHLNTVYGSPLPEGVTVDATASSTLLTGGATKGRITLKAAENAPVLEKQQIVVMANVSLNFVMKATYASQPIWISIAK